MQAGSVFALEDEDWIFLSYRESAIGLLRGMPARVVLQWWRAHPSGWWNPADYNVASICVPIGTHVPHAAGLAGKSCAATGGRDRVLRRRRDVRRLVPRRRQLRSRDAAPLVLFCNNNQWAISTPLSAQTAAETLADKAVGYGMPGVRVDGGDVLAVTRRRATRSRARGR